MTSAHDIVAELTSRGLTVATAESLTGGLVVAELVSVAGASAVVAGGVVAYQTEVKRTLLGVDADLLARRGPVDAEVAAQMASRVRHVLAVDGRDADVGLSTTGVAGPDPQGGHAPGTVFVAVAIGDDVTVVPLQLEGDREAIRRGVVSELLSALFDRLAATRE
ncbi:CinA family protein [Frigoribacterium sp. 2-23]|uniref:CinA family protein n=1 Tax=Frigoribacterium sp. 2-23 TaxID=3415006 RepID=UPI003C700F3F